MFHDFTYYNLSLGFTFKSFGCLFRFTKHTKERVMSVIAIMVYKLYFWYLLKYWDLLARGAQEIKEVNQ